MDLLFMQQREYLPDELRIEQRFSAGKCHAAAIPVKQSVFQKNREQFFRRIGFSANLQCILPAIFRTCSAQYAVFPLDFVFCSGKNVNTSRTDRFTFSASPAKVLMINQQRFSGNRFRIVTPQTVQGASFDKNSCPCSGPVVYCKAADICNKNPLHIQRFPSASRISQFC